MTDTTQYPFIKLAAEWEAKHHALRTQIAEMGREMASVVAERDALKAQQPKAPERKLREVNGATYQDGRWWYKNFSYRTVCSLIAQWNVTFTDADFPAIYALKDDPYEPVETVDEVLKEFLVWGYKQGMTDANTRAPWCTRLRAAFAAEQGGAE